MSYRFVLTLFFVGLSMSSAGAQSTGFGVLPGWSTELIASATPANRMCSLVIEPNGRQHVLYFTGTYGVVGGPQAYKSRLPGSPFLSAPPEALGDTVSNVASLAVGPNGDVYASHSQTNPESDNVRVRVGGGSWADLGGDILNGSFVHGGYGGAVSVSPTGTVGVAYFYGPSEDAHYAEYQANGTWAVTPVATSGRVGKGSHLAFDSAGGAHIVYQDQDQSRLTYVHRPPGGTWQSPEIVGPWAAGAAPMGLAVVNPGLVAVLRDLAPPGETDTLDRRTSGGWAEDMEFPQGYNRGSIVLHEGKVHAAMERLDGHIDYVFEHCGEWIVRPLTDHGRLPDIAISPAGDVVIAFTSTASSSDLVLASRPLGGIDLGQQNTPTASLILNGIGTGCGHNSVVTSLGQPLSFEFLGAPGSSYILVTGPLNIGNIIIPCVGSLDLGNQSSLCDITIVFDGLTTPLFGIPPSGRAQWVLTWPFVVPATIDFQALIVSPTCGGAIGTLTAAATVVGN